MNTAGMGTQEYRAAVDEACKNHVATLLTNLIHNIEAGNQPAIYVAMFERGLSNLKTARAVAIGGSDA